ncbi:MAG: sugar phosphate isomerase/epimerase [Rariglobus sp.]|jgi:sugar phosphate isomerase/epimerase|nr:sugar phosphate isomerase/epimerase [Rariglobus sp.]
MRLYYHLYQPFASATEWAAAHRAAGFGAADALLETDASDAVVAAYVEAARRANLVIGEVGAWSNPIDPDPVKAAAALDLCRRNLDLAERLGARCCVNIAGSRNPAKWDGPHADNFSPDTFDLIVQSVRSIVDAVKPRRAAYALETMPWIFPSSPDEYLALLRAIDRPGAVAVHLDPVNMINSPARAYRTTEFLRECFAKLGPHIRSCHAKDIVLRDHLTVHLDECRPGAGVLDYATYLRELSRLDPDTTLRIEHLAAEDYPMAADHLREVAARNNLSFR